MTFPSCFVGGDPWADAMDAVIAHSASAAANTVRFIATLLVEAWTRQFLHYPNTRERAYR